MEAPAQYGPTTARPRLTVVKDEGAGYSALPHDIMRDTRLSRDARLLYAVLQMYWWQNGETHVSNATLCEDMDCSDSQLRRYLGELLRGGRITARRSGRGQAKAYAPVKATVSNEAQPFISERLNRSSVSGSASNRSPVTSQPFTGDDLNAANRSPVTDPYKKTPEKKTKEEDVPPPGVDAASAAPSPTAAKPKAESRARRLPDEAVLTDAHRDAAERAGFGAERASAEWDKFVDYHRAKGSRMLDWLAAWRTWLRNAVEFDARRNGAQRGSGPAPYRTQAGREQTRQHSKWSDPHWDRVMGGAAMRGGPRDKEAPRE